MVAAALHGHGQLVRAAEGRDEQRDQHRHQRLDALGESAIVDHGTTGFLGVHDLLGLFDQSRDEPQRNGHHHGQLMHREMNFRQRAQQILNRVRQHDGAGGVGQKARTCDQCADAHRQQDGIADALPVNFQHPDVDKRLALAGDKKQVEHRREQHDGHNRL